MRIVSLIASATEIACALGLRNHLVGRSHECDYPTDVLELPILSSPKVDPGMESGAIDRGVRDLVRDGLSGYNVRVEDLERLAPDLIVTQDHCQVCAVSLDDVKNALCSMTDSTTNVCSLHPETLSDVRTDFQRVADAAGVSGAGRELRARFDQRLREISARAAEGSTPRVALIEWLDPPMIAGGWMPEIARIAGASPVIVTDPKRFATVTWQDIATANPDIVVIIPCGYETEKTLTELDNPDLAESVRQIPATRNGCCYVVDGNAYFNRPGPRLADSAEILAAIVSGELDEIHDRYGRGTAVPWR